MALTESLAPEQARFFYRVRGWLRDRWLPLGTSGLVRLQGLPPGSYTVEIRGETSRGEPAANRLRLPLTVTAEWWRHPAAWAAGTALALALLYGWQQVRLRQARRETALRTRLSADLHDELGALLTRVNLQADLLRELPPAAVGPRLSALADDSRAAAATVRDIIWSVSTEADTLGGLLTRMEDALAHAARAAPLLHTELRTENLPPDPTTPLLPAIRQHIYLIFKEAVTNVLRHAPAATRLTATLRYHSPDRLTLTVRNDGLASAVPSSRGGQGLRNMRHRAALLGWALVAEREAEDGWVVRVG